MVLQCNIHVKTNPVISSLWWTTGTTESPIPKFPQKYSGGNLQKPTLTIFNVAYSDAGIYKCKAHNSNGQSYATTELIVGGKLNWRAEYKFSCIHGVEINMIIIEMYSS